MTRAVTSALLALCLLLPGTAEAQAGLRVVEVDRVRVDGSARDWTGVRWASLGSGQDSAMRYALGHDADALYVIAQVFDQRVVRNTPATSREDAVILTLASPGRRARGIDLYLFAGVPGTAGSAAFAPVGQTRLRRLSTVQVVEGPLERGTGYTLEVRIPFGAFPGAARDWDRHRASIRLRDVDSEARPEVVAEPSLVPVDRRHLDRLAPLRPTGGSSGALEAFLASRNLGAARPSHELTGNVIGDREPERVYVVHEYVVLTGAAVPGGGYAFHRLPVERASDVREASMRDLTGDGLAELILTLRQRNQAGERDLYQVFTLQDPIRPMFAIEVRKAMRGGSIESRVRVLRARRGAPEIEVRAGRASGLDASSYRERPADDAVAMLLPWGPVRARRYRWDGRRFAQTREEANPRYRPPETAPSRPTSTPAARTEPETPSTEALLAGFRREHRIRRGSAPRFRGRANLAGGREPEVFQVYGRALVAVGPGIQGGRSWLEYEVPVSADADVLDVRAADVTGDRRAEILIRVAQHFGDVHRELLLVHQVQESGFPQLLQVEVARQRGSEELRNEVVTRGGRLEIRPGRARGFSAENWPFTRDASDSAAPIRLPWNDRAARYRLSGGRLQPR
ncbi:MAG: hypothetical protein AB8I08_13445 [Sandaracinaceae bacterium]